MADTIRRRMQVVDPFIDDRLEPAMDALRRAKLRARVHGLWRGEKKTQHRLARVLRLPIDSMWRTPYFGAAWAEIEAASPALARRRVALADLAVETARATRLRDWLRGATDISGATDRADNPLPLAAE